MKVRRLVCVLLALVALVAVLPGGSAMPAYAQGTTPPRQKATRPKVGSTPRVSKSGSQRSQPRTPVVTAAAPTNDDFNTPTDTTLPYQLSPVEDISGATEAVDDPDMGCGNADNGQGNYHTVWFRFVPTADGDVQANAFNSTYDTVLAAFTGTRGNLTLLSCNDDNWVDLTSQVEIPVTAGVTYYFEVASYDAILGAGESMLHFSLDVTRKSIENSFLRANVSLLSDSSFMPGGFVLGTAADAPLLSGYPWDYIYSTITTARVITDTQTGPTDYRLGETILPTVQPTVSNGVVNTTWQTSEFRVVQRLYFVPTDAPQNGKKLAIEYELTNLTQASAQMGARLLLDLKVGDNEGPPIRLPGLGTFTTEQEFTSFPDAWLASQSPTFDPGSLTASGVLRGTGVTTPNKVILGDAISMYQTDWDYAITPDYDMTGDDGVALYFSPGTLAAGQSRTIRTYYGVFTPATYVYLPTVLKNFR